jgi:hypothetical protein
MGKLEGKRPLGRLRCRWEIRMDIRLAGGGRSGFKVAQYRNI